MSPFLCLLVCSLGTCKVGDMVWSRSQRQEEESGPAPLFPWVR